MPTKRQISFDFLSSIQCLKMNEITRLISFTSIATHNSVISDISTAHNSRSQDKGFILFELATQRPKISFIIGKYSEYIITVRWE